MIGLLRRGRRKLVYAVTVRANEGFGSYVYGIYASEVIAKQAKHRIEESLAQLNHWHVEKIISDHWVTINSYPLSNKPVMAYTISKGRGTYKTRQIIEIIP